MPDGNALMPFPLSMFQFNIPSNSFKIEIGEGREEGWGGGEGITLNPSQHFHLCPEMHLSLNLGTSYKTGLFVVFYMTSCLTELCVF